MIKPLATTFILAASFAAQAADAPPPYGPAIGLVAARQCVTAGQAFATKNQWQMVMTVVDSGGHVVLTERMDNAQYGSVTPALKKARTAAAFRRPSKVFEDLIAQGGAGLRILRLSEVLPVDGGLPLVIKGALVGAIGVSGGTSAQDGEAAAACVAALTNK